MYRKIIYFNSNILFPIKTIAKISSSLFSYEIQIGYQEIPISFQRSTRLRFPFDTLEIGGFIKRTLDRPVAHVCATSTYFN